MYEIKVDGTNDMFKPENGIFMGLWVGSGHDSPWEIAAASAAMAMMDGADEEEEQEAALYSELWSDNEESND